MAPRGSEPTQAVEVMSPVAGLGLPTLRPPGAPIYTPTPDAPHSLPSMRTDPESYVVRVGDLLGGIAGSYGVSVEQIVQENGIANPNLLAIGQVLTIPAPSPGPPGPDFKVIPDSELVYGPASALFDLEAFVQQGGGYLVNYREEVDDQYLSGAQIVQRIAQDFSLNPRLLLALLQHQSGWWSDPAPGEARKGVPLGIAEPKARWALPPTVLGGQPTKSRLLPVPGQRRCKLGIRRWQHCAAGANHQRRHGRGSTILRCPLRPCCLGAGGNRRWALCYLLRPVRLPF